MKLWVEQKLVGLLGLCGDLDRASAGQGLNRGFVCVRDAFPLAAGVKIGAVGALAVVVLAHFLAFSEKSLPAASMYVRVKG